MFYHASLFNNYALRNRKHQFQQITHIFHTSSYNSTVVSESSFLSRSSLINLTTTSQLLANWSHPEQPLQVDQLSIQSKWSLTFQVFTKVQYWHIEEKIIKVKSWCNSSFTTKWWEENKSKVIRKMTYLFENYNLTFQNYICFEKSRYIHL